MMTAEQNKAIFLRFIDELRRGNLAIIDEVCSPDFAFHSPNWPNWPRGIESARKLVTYGSQLYRDARTTINDIIAENDKVAVRWTITGTWIGQPVTKLHLQRRIYRCTGENKSKSARSKGKPIWGRKI